MSVGSFVKLCGYFGNRRGAGGGRDPGPVTPCSLSFFIQFLLVLEKDGKDQLDRSCEK